MKRESRCARRNVVINSCPLMKLLMARLVPSSLKLYLHISWKNKIWEFFSRKASFLVLFH